MTRKLVRSKLVFDHVPEYAPSVFFLMQRASFSILVYILDEATRNYLSQNITIAYCLPNDHFPIFSNRTPILPKTLGSIKLLSSTGFLVSMGWLLTDDWPMTYK